jgi:nitroreductase
MFEAMFNRISTRTYQKTPLSHELLNKIEHIRNEVELKQGPFGNQIKTFFYNSPYVDKDVDIKIGTYGFIKNAPHFIGGITQNSFEHIVDFGFIFEKLILKLTELDLGTVWLGGTFNRKAMNHLVSSEEIIPALTAVGYKSEKTTLRDKTTRHLAKSDHRKAIEELFFEQNLNHPIDMNHRLIEHLECVRCAPSASNKQPWRLIIQNDTIDFYLQRNKNYAQMLPFDIQALDIGIAICHFTLSLEAKRVNYAYFNKEVEDEPNFKYVLSVVLK